VCSRNGNATFSKTLRSVNKAPNWKSIPIAAACRIELRLIHGTDILASKKNLPVLSPQLPTNQPQSRGLAPSGGAHQRRHLAPGDGKGNIVKNGPVAVSETNTADLDQSIC
jgi:hypothetical protein